MKFESIFIVVLCLVGLSSASLTLNLTGGIGGAYPMLFVDCEGSCNDWNVTNTVRGHTQQFSSVIPTTSNLLFLELSGMTEATPIIVNAERKYTMYTAYPLNLPYVDYNRSTTIKVSDILAAGTVSGDDVLSAGTQAVDESIPASSTVAGLVDVLASDTSIPDFIVNKFTGVVYVVEPKKEFRFPTVGELLKLIGVR
jgi:hypothetical protein